MGVKGQETKAKLAASMLELIQSSGYTGSGVNDVIRHAGAPKGSLYFHFPDGKEGLGAAAVELAAEQFDRLIREAASAADDPATVVRLAVQHVSDLVAGSGFRLGCPVSIVALETGVESDRLRSACAAAFRGWIEPTRHLLERSGFPADEAQALATVVVSSIEGATIIARATQSVEPFVAAADVLASLLAHRRPLSGSNA